MIWASISLIVQKIMPPLSLCHQSDFRQEWLFRFVNLSSLRAEKRKGQEGQAHVACSRPVGSVCCSEGRGKQQNEFQCMGTCRKCHRCWPRQPQQGKWWDCSGQRNRNNKKAAISRNEGFTIKLSEFGDDNPPTHKMTTRSQDMIWKHHLNLGTDHFLPNKLCFPHLNSTQGNH